MNVLIMGCGRTGSMIGATLDGAGHQVTVLDSNPDQLRRLPEDFRGQKAVGNGMDGEALERAGIQEMDAFIAVTQGDNRNYFASQLAKEVYGVARVICRVKDPRRQEIFGHLGIQTYSPTSAGAATMIEMLQQPEPA